MGAYVPIQQDREPGWFETLGQIYQNRAQQQLMQARAQEMQQKDQDLRRQQRDFQDDQEIRRALRPQTNADGTQEPREVRNQIAVLRGLGTSAALKQADALEQAELDRQQNHLRLQQQQQELMKTHVENAATLAAASAYADPSMAQNAWDNFYRYSKANNLDPDNHLSPVYDPKAAQYYAHLGMAARQQMQQQLEQDHAADYARRNQSLQQYQTDRLNEMQRYHDEVLATRRPKRDGATAAPIGQPTNGSQAALPRMTLRNFVEEDR